MEKQSNKRGFKMKERNIIKIYYNNENMLTIEQDFDELTNLGQVLMELELLKLNLISKYAKGYKEV